MTSDTPAETLTAALGRLLFAREGFPVLDGGCGDTRTGRQAEGIPDRIDALRNGQMLLPGIAEPRLWSHRRVS